MSLTANKKIIFIPADNIAFKISRSHYLAKTLASTYDVYFLTWYDNRDAKLNVNKINHPIFFSFKCLLKSFFRSFSITKTEFGYINVQASVLMNYLFPKVIGIVPGRDLMRWYNKKTLQKLVEKIKPDIIFHADGFYYFPSIGMAEGIKQITDIQDDYDQPDTAILNNGIAYNTFNYAFAQKNFAVSQDVADRLGKLYNTTFEELPNGVDFNEYRNITDIEIQTLKQGLGIQNRFIVTFIGTAHKFDPDFVKEIASLAETKFPEMIFLIVGNVPAVEGPNIIQVGPKSSEEAKKFYQISDVGIILNDTRQSKFLNHSVPLKIFQYSACKKPIITFPLAWLEDKDFSNIVTMKSKNADEWIDAIKSLKSFSWNNTLENSWIKYDWLELAKKITTAIEE